MLRKPPARLKARSTDETFGIDDVFILNGVSFDRSDLSVYLGSAILGIDTDNDGFADTTIVLGGDYSGSESTVKDLDGATAIAALFPPKCTRRCFSH